MNKYFITLLKQVVNQMGIPPFEPKTDNEYFAIRLYEIVKDDDIEPFRDITLNAISFLAKNEEKLKQIAKEINKYLER